jgi:nucleotide-binding universal stress UspA family protein
MVDTVLVATDGSEHADRAVALAAELSKKYGAKLIALHVTAQSWKAQIPEALKAYAHSEHIEASEREILETVGKQILHGAEVIARQEGAEKIETILETGDPAATVLQVAKDQAAQFLVTGNRGLGGLSGLLQGSVSQKIAAHAPCTCITVR